jgi:predicted nuclease of restriction endonuclease-like (RecB) superfamily
LLQFSWSQLQELIRLDDPLKRAFYENECLKSNWSVRQLQRQIGSLLFERTGLSKNKAAVVARARRQEARQNIEDLIRDPYVLEFTGLGERPEYTESELEKALLDHLQKFLLELGVGFCFEARQFRVTLGNKHDYVDLVFYHRRLRCHVLLDLKVRPFNHGDAGQMNFYLNYFKDRLAAPGDQPPVGIILCSDKHGAEVEYATAGISNKLFVSRYLTMLPSAEQLQRFVEADRDRIEAATKRRRRPKIPKARKRRQPARKQKR